MELRAYQTHTIRALWDWFNRNPQGAPLLVLPTGAGKSIVIADIARRAVTGNRRVLILAHRKELLDQNYQKLAAMMPWGNIGLYSAGLKRRDTDTDVLVAGIQSVYQRTDELGPFALVIIDECHLVPPDGEGRYRTLIDGLQKVNPSTRFLGLSATPYRLGSGLLTENSDLWTEIAHEVEVRPLIEAGYLAPLVNKSGIRKPDLSAVAIRGGEFVSDAMEKAFNRLDLVEAACEEVVRYGAARKSWLLFASGVEHAENIAAVLRRVGVPTGVVTGETAPMFRDGILDDFRNGRLRALVNCEVLTTGFDHPAIDLIAVLRGTKSTALWVQVCGRGMRVAEGKKNCLILDFGRNAELHGPVDRIRIVKRWNPARGKLEDAVETVPCRECPECHTLVPISSQECVECGYAFLDIVRLNHQPIASTAPVLSEPAKIIEVDVISMRYSKHLAKGKEIPVLKAEHVIGAIEGVPVKSVPDWVCFEHSGFAKEKAWKWWIQRRRGEATFPLTIDEALEREHELRIPKRIAIQQDGKYWRVVEVLSFVSEADAEAAAKETAEAEAHFDELGVNIF